MGIDRERLGIRVSNQPPIPTICKCGSAKIYHRPEDHRDHEYEPRYPAVAVRLGWDAALNAVAHDMEAFLFDHPGLPLAVIHQIEEWRSALAQPAHTPQPALDVERRVKKGQPIGHWPLDAEEALTDFVIWWDNDYDEDDCPRMSKWLYNFAVRAAALTTKDKT